MLKSIAAIISAALLASVAFPASANVTKEDIAAAPGDWREVAPEDLIIMKTTKGDVVIEIAPGFSPKHGEQIRRIVRSGLYTGTLFHRVINDFMAQGGDIDRAHNEPSGQPNLPGEFVFRRSPADMPLDAIRNEPEQGKLKAGYYNGFPVLSRPDAQSDFTFDAKVESWMPHCAGVTSMARTDDPNSANDQFFLMRAETEFLNRKYTSWGRMLQGLDVAQALNVGEPPSQPDMLVSVVMASDIIPAKRPRAWVMRTNSEAFNAIVSQQDEGTSICDMPPVPTLVEFPE